MITAKVIEDSVSDDGIRLTTLQLCYPRFIHSEFMTHRVFSRSASSSRAIPVKKMIEQVRTNPAMPVHWGKNQPGMQAHEQLTGKSLELVISEWGMAAKCAADIAEMLTELGLHKQVANRILEPFQHIHVVVTATEWDNFFNLRCHPDAQPEMRVLAETMRDAMGASLPKSVGEGQWHLPYVSEEERADESLKHGDVLKLSTARCARVSYMKHDGTKPNIEEDIALHDKLVGSVPLHASPAEHSATPMPEYLDNRWSGNFHGWIQYRKTLEI